jgi:hypothetical protein
VIGAAWHHGTLRVSLDIGAFHGLIEALESARELRFPVAIPAAGNRGLVPCTLTGPRCDSQDTILDRVWLPMPHAGDRMLIGNTGAYATCYSGRSTFNGYPAPAVKIKAKAAWPAVLADTVPAAPSSGAGPVHAVDMLVYQHLFVIHEYRVAGGFPLEPELRAWDAGHQQAASPGPATQPGRPPSIRPRPERHPSR